MRAGPHTKKLASTWNAKDMTINDLRRYTCGLTVIYLHWLRLQPVTTCARTPGPKNVSYLLTLYRNKIKYDTRIFHIGRTHDDIVRTTNVFQQPMPTPPVVTPEIKKVIVTHDDFDWITNKRIL